MRLRENSFIKSSIVLISGSILAQIISIIASPLMTRLYTEAQIGEYTLILTAVSMFGSVICGRYDATIVSEENETNVWALIKLSAFITVGLSIVASIGYTVYYSFLDETSMSWFATFIWIFVLLVLTGIGNILVSYNNRKKEYKLMTSVHLVRTLGKEATLVGLGFLKNGTLGLLISQVMSLILGVGKQSKSLRKNISDVVHTPISRVRENAKKHRRQLMYSVPAHFANNFSYSSLNLFVSGLFGLDILAYYSMSFRMLGLPLSLLSANVSKVFFEKAAREHETHGSYRKSFLQTTGLLALVAVPMVIVLMIFAPMLFELFFGDGWYQSGVYVRYLAPMFGIRFIVSPLTPCMTVSNKQGNELMIQLLFVGASVVSYTLCRVIDSRMETFLLTVTILYSVIYSIYYIYMFKISKGDKQK